MILLVAVHDSETAVEGEVFFVFGRCYGRANPLVVDPRWVGCAFVFLEVLPCRCECVLGLGLQYIGTDGYDLLVVTDISCVIIKIEEVERHVHLIESLP